MSLDAVVIKVEVVHHVVIVTLEQGSVNRRMFDLVYDQIFSLLDNLIDAGMVCWIKSRADHFIVKPSREMQPMEVETEIRRRLKL